MNCVCSQNVAVCYLNDFFQETAHEKAQKYKEGKSVLERYVDSFLGKSVPDTIKLNWSVWDGCIADGTGLRSRVLMEATTGSLQKLMLVEVMQMTHD